MKQFFFFIILFTLSLIHCAAQKNNPLFSMTVNGKQGYIDKTGKIIIEPKFNGVSDFSDGLARIYVSGKFTTAYIDKTGTVSIPAQFDIGSNFSEGLAWVGFDPTKSEYKFGNLTLYTSPASDSFNYNIGYINQAGNYIVKPIFKYAEDFSEGLAVVETQGRKFGFIDKSGKFAISPKFEWAGSFSEGLAWVFVNGRYGFIDKTGKIVIKPQFTKAGDFSEGVACVKIGGTVRQPYPGMKSITTTKVDRNYGYIDKSGKLLFKIIASDARSFSEGLARIEINGKYGFIDKTGKVVIDPEIDALSEMSEGLALVLLKGDNKSFGFIDKTGKVVIETNYSLVNDFKNGLAQVRETVPKFSTDISNAKYGYIDKSGKVIWQPTN